ncbi:hypothetical protein L5515_017367 [Caenorhabditis briggsae]|uniref:Uncharacterized protein n=1 Tax=Caenorhabditis briggsae TaxID=6238 RepID=A0AAE9JSI1_CAEBR|nr:hypothetical protein L5515_017367 [Caenorhabditis briggsae]
MLLTKRKIKAEKSQLERENDLQILIDSWIRHGFVSDLQPSPSRRRTKDHLLQVDFFCPQLTTDIITFKGNLRDALRTACEQETDIATILQLHCPSFFNNSKNLIV